MARTAFRTFAVNEDGNRVFPYANNDGSRFVVNWNSTSNNLNRNGRLLVSRNSLQKKMISL